MTDSINNDENLSKQAVLARLHHALDEIKQINEITRTPSLSFGVLFRGEIIFTENLGTIDTATNRSANTDTRYHIGSVSKCFVSALVGIAVSEGKLEWKAPISKYIPEFNPFDDPDVGKGARILDCLRHSAGIGRLTSLILGPKGKIFSKEEDFIELINQSPTSNSKGEKRYNSHHYSNEGYALVAVCLERVYGMRYSELLRQKILQPLQLERTGVCKPESEKDDNVAYGTATLEDGRVITLKSESTTDGNYTPVFSTWGIVSTVKDMLNWAKAVMATEKCEREAVALQKPNYPASNPLRNISVTRGKAYWTRPSKDKYQNDVQYCMGWLRVIMPSSMLGSLTMNRLTRPEGNDGIQDEYILGTESPKTEVLLHTGAHIGSTCAFFTFSETQSAIIVFGNGATFGDPCDWIGQILTQALLGSKPHVDFSTIAKLESEARYKEMAVKIFEKHQKSRDISKPEAPKQDYVGKYTGRTITLNIQIENCGDTTGFLTVKFNGVPELNRMLEYWSNDTYSFFAKTADEMQEQCLAMSDTGILKFKRNEQNNVVIAEWEFCKDEYPIVFKRMN